MEESYGLQDYSDGSVTASIDPVCGKTVDESHSAGKVNYAGEDYYFCSHQCRSDFEEEPSRYAGMAQ